MNDPKKEQKRQIPFGQIFLDDMFLLLLAGVAVPFMIYFAWGYIDLASLKTMPEPNFAAVTSTPPDTSQQLDGSQLVSAKGCIGCHSADGTARVGPTWLGLFGAEQTLADGSVVTVDDGYIKRAILDPSADVPEGQTAGIMPPYEGQLSDDELNAIITYIKGLQ